MSTGYGIITQFILDEVTPLSFFPTFYPSLLLSGFLIYFGYGMWHSAERQRLLQAASNGGSSKKHSKSDQAEVGKEQESFICLEKY